jgi:hypothetical protein
VLRGRPLYDNEADARFFVNTPEWELLRRAASRRINTAVVGSRGMGKTTHLRQLQRTLREEGAPVAFVDATAVKDSAGLLDRIRSDVVGTRSDLSPAQVLARLARVEPQIVLIDGSAAPDAIYELFGRMRDLLWQMEHTWIVAIDDADRASVLRPPADAFFDVLITLSRWSPAALIGMIGRRTEDSPSALSRLAEAARGNPREALRLVTDALVHDTHVDERIAERSALEVAAAELGRPHSMLLAVLLEEGQGSSSDEQIQHALGVSRSRLTQLFRELLEAELVTAETVKPEGGPGRPRTVYRARLEVR